jgi:hypothetical protein
MRKSEMLQIGKAGEYLVCADLILKGFISYPSEQGLPYDVLLDTGEKLLRVQVKTTEGLRVVPQRNKETKCYIFNIKRHGKGNKQRYSSQEIDLFALVCLDTMKIAYLTNTEMPDTINLRAEELRGTYYDEKGIKDYEVVKGYIDAGYSTGYIHESTGISKTQISRMRREDYKPHKTNAKYFTDFIREKDWFYGL